MHPLLPCVLVGQCDCGCCSCAVAAQDGLPRWVTWGCVGLTSSSSLLLQVTVSDDTVPKIPAQGRSGFLFLKCSFAVGKVK